MTITRIREGQGGRPGNRKRRRLRKKKKSWIKTQEEDPEKNKKSRTGT
jgi:hypothetical protein